AMGPKSSRFTQIPPRNRAYNPISTLSCAINTTKLDSDQSRHSFEVFRPIPVFWSEATHAPTLGLGLNLAGDVEDRLFVELDYVHYHGWRAPGVIPVISKQKVQLVGSATGRVRPS